MGLAEALNKLGLTYCDIGYDLRAIDYFEQASPPSRSSPATPPPRHATPPLPVPRRASNRSAYAPSTASSRPA